MGYSVKEISLSLGLSERAIVKRCFKSEVRKINNKYSIEDKHIEAWIKSIKEARLKEPQKNLIGTSSEPIKYEVLKVKNIQDLKLVEIEDFDFTFDNIEGNLVFVPKDKVFAEYTEQEYLIAEQRMNEWHTLQKEIEHQQQIFNAETKGNEQVIEHYKKQWEYQKDQSTRILDIHEKLIQAVNQQNKIIIQKQVMEAIDKEVINKDTWKRDL